MTRTVDPVLESFHGGNLPIGSLSFSSRSETSSCPLDTVTLPTPTQVSQYFLTLYETFLNSYSRGLFHTNLKNFLLELQTCRTTATVVYFSPDSCLTFHSSSSQDLHVHLPKKSRSLSPRITLETLTVDTVLVVSLPLV